MIKTICSRVKASRKQIITLLLCVLLAAIGEMLLPSFLAVMINKGVAQSENQMIYVTMVVMIGITIMSGLVDFFSVKISARIATDFAARLREETFTRVQAFSAKELDHFGTASLVTRSTSDITNVQNFLTLLLRVGILAPIMAVAGLFFSAVTGGKISFVLLLAIPVLLLVLGLIVSVASHFTVRLRKDLDRMNKLFLESLEGVRVIRAFNKQRKENVRFEQANSTYTQTAMRTGRINSAVLPSVNVVFGMTMVGVLAVGARYVAEGSMEVGYLVANGEYISMVLMSVMMLSMVIMMFPNAYACAKRIAEVLEMEISIEDGDGAFEQRPLRATVEFQHVSFTYPGASEPILRDVSFKVESGQTVAIVGGTGRGKSTILKLMLRFYDPTEGRILVDGLDARAYPVDVLHGLFGYVPQRNTLFSGDIGTNLNYGKPDGEAWEWREAAEIACADEFINQQEAGYHHHVAQNGTNLSGGQRQRLAIARAIMKKPEIYVFDDSFSALDVKTDQRLRANLKNKIKDATFIMVAQRLSTIMEADQILVVDDGQIVGAGTHAQLLHGCSLYREIAAIQLGEEVPCHG